MGRATINHTTESDKEVIVSQPAKKQDIKHSTSSTPMKTSRRQRKKKITDEIVEADEEEDETSRLLRELKEKQDAEDNAFLDTVIAAKPTSSSLQTTSTGESGSDCLDGDFLSLQDLDLRMLDLDSWVRMRFTGMQDHSAADAGHHRGGPGRRGGARNAPRRGGGGMMMLPPQQQANIVNKRLYFCQQKDDWSKPPSFIAGGIGLNKLTTATTSVSYTMYSFAWSKEYQQLQAIYEIVKQLGDPNYIVMFLANNPYHVEGFLDLGMILIRSGHVEKGVDCIRRCIFAYECYAFEPFPFHASHARMNPMTPENKTYFQAMFRYMQISARQGYSVLAVDIVRILLALNPMDDLLGLLLHFDYLLLQAGKYEVILQLCGLQVEQLLLPKDDDANAEESVMKIVESLQHWQRSYLIDVASEEGDEGDDETKQKKYTIEHLANWWYSLALAMFLWTQRAIQQRRFESSDESLSTTSVPSLKIANTFLQQALERYPTLIEELLPRLEVPTRLIQRVKSHEYVIAARNSIPQGSYQHRVMTTYVMKQEKIWLQKSEAVDWLTTNVEQFLQRKESIVTFPYEDQELTLTTSLLQEKYANIPLEDFQEEFNRLPVDLQAIDEDLMDPRVLAGGVRFPKLNQQLLQMKSVVKYNQRVAWFNAQETQYQTKQRQGLFALSILIDLTRPLLQLFLLTLLPWIAVPRRSR